MELHPFIGDEMIAASSIRVRVEREDQERVTALLARTKVIREVTDQISFDAARRLAGELKAMDRDIQASKRAAKTPFEAILAAIEQLAKDIWAEGKSEQDRLLGALNGYVARLEAARKAEEEKRLAAEQARKEEADRRIAQAQLERDAAKAAQLQAEKEISESMDRMFAEPPKALVPGGRVDHKYTFKLVDLPQLINNHRLELLRWELNHSACMNAVRLQLERNPDKTPILPGIEITREISVSVKAQGRIE
jgi:hypothetical protein